MAICIAIPITYLQSLFLSFKGSVIVHHAARGRGAVFEVLRELCSRQVDACV
jgi:hypothetical protein